MDILPPPSGDGCPNDEKAVIRKNSIITKIFVMDTFLSGIKKRSAQSSLRAHPTRSSKD